VTSFGAGNQHAADHQIGMAQMVFDRMLRRIDGLDPAAELRVEAA